MAAPVMLMTDGTAAAVALARWLNAQLIDARVVETRSAVDLERVTEAYRSRKPYPRLVILSENDSERGSGVVNGSAALTAARTWLEALPHFDQRFRGVERIQSGVLGEEQGHDAVLGLLRRIRPAQPVRKASGKRETVARPKRGRPPGTDPFHGAGFDICVALLLSPRRSWSERTIASAVERSPTATHRMLVELARRAYLTRERGATALTQVEQLRDDLVEAWRVSVAARPGARRFLSMTRTPLMDVLKRAAVKSDRALLAGWSAIQGREGALGGPTTIYAEPEFVAALESLGLAPYQGSRADLVIWTPPERGVFLAPTPGQPLGSTNRVLTYLDLLTDGDPRAIAAANAVWHQTALNLEDLG